MVLVDADAFAQGDVAATPGEFPVTLPPEESTLPRRLRFQRIDRERGLPQNTVSSVVQDKTGFMWLATGDGLARYDGQRIRTFRHDPEDATSISASYVNALLLARDGSLWVGTEGGGVNRYLPDQGAFQRYMASEAPDTLNSGSVSSLSEGADGRIWIGTRGGGVAVLDPATGKVRSYSMEDGIPREVVAVITTKDGAVWIGTGAGVYRLGPQQASFELQFHDHELLKSALITSLHQARDGSLWIGTDGNGLATASPDGTLQIFRAAPDRPEGLADDSVADIYEDRGGRMWIGTEKALHLLDRSTGRFERHLLDSSDPMSLPGQTKDVFEDAAGAIWVGTLGGGAALLDPRSLHFTYYKTLGASAVAVHGKDLWIGTGESLCRWRGAEILQGHCYEIGFPTTILVDRTNTVWVGTMGEGLLRRDPQSNDRWIAYQNEPGVETSLAPAPVVRLHEDRAGRLWVGFIGGGLQMFDRERGRFNQYALPSDVVYMIKDDPEMDDVLWLGTGDQGLVRLDVNTGEILPFTPKPDDTDSRTDNAVTDFVFDGPDTVWLATFGGGLKRLDRKTGQFEHFRRSDGMPSDTIYSILVDGTGKLWLTSLAGLARFDPKSREVRVFGTIDGLQSVEFALGARAVAEDGRFIVGGIHGFNMFRPDQIELDAYRPPLVITSISVLDEPYGGQQSATGTRALELAYDEGFVNVDFAALSYSGSNQLRFEYRLEGLNDRWLSSDSGSVRLTGLEDGDYTLHLRARNRHGVESEPIQLAIGIAPPPWRTWWAYSIYGLLLGGVVFSIYRYQKVRIDRLQKLARLATVEREFEVTAAVQSWFLPESVSYSSGTCDLVGFYRGAEKCSGDWWWYEDLGGGKLWIIVADVTGHGAGPAMLTAAVAMGLSVQAGQARESVVERLSRVNREVLIRCKGKATMTMTAVVLDQNTGEGMLYGMGGLPALLVAREGRHSVVGASGTPIGSVPELSVGERPVRLGPGDRLLITTDGIVETTVGNGRQLGFRRFVNVMKDVRGVPLPLAVNKIVQDVDLARGNNPQEDDFTFCLLERRA